jgi:hypothetical protein
MEINVLELKEILKEEFCKLVDEVLGDSDKIASVVKHIHDLLPEKREVKSEWKTATIPQPEEIIKSLDTILLKQKEKENTYYDSLGLVAPSEIIGLLIPENTLAGTNKDDI